MSLSHVVVSLDFGVFFSSVHHLSLSCFSLMDVIIHVKLS